MAKFTSTETQPNVGVATKMMRITKFKGSIIFKRDNEICINIIQRTKCKTIVNVYINSKEKKQ